MKRFWYVLLAAITTLTTDTAPAPIAANAYASAQLQPAYAKWGRLAIKETKKKYPNASIVDYLYIGGKTISSSAAEETFKLWLRQNRREWGVYVRIQFEPATEKVLSINFQETVR